MQEQLFLSNHNESGRTMLEMLGVLGIMGIIMYGAVQGINYGMTTYKINQVYNDVQDQINGIMDLYSWSREYPDGEFTSIVQTNDIFSREDNTHPLGGSIKVKGTGDSFTLTYDSIGKDECRRLWEMEWGTIKLSSPASSTNCVDSNEMVWEPL